MIIILNNGSTMVACLNTNRNGIGIEMDDKYFEIAKNRVEQRRKEL
jgi:DNA modification methylase